MSKQDHRYSIYHAGDIFDFKHLVGNHALAKAIAKVSKKKFNCILPQDLEQTDFRSSAIKDNDLFVLAKSDLALFNFDGTELDSGTVVEFIVAKMLNIPSVIIRTDFREGGDQNKDGDPWNLMVSNYPYTRTLKLHSMKIYQARGPKDLVEVVAEAVVEEFERLLDMIKKEHYESIQNKVASRDCHSIYEKYDWVLKSCSQSLRDKFSSGSKEEVDELLGLVSDKYMKFCLPPTK